MGLSLLFSSKEKKLSPKAEEILNVYIAGAKKEIGYVRKNTAKDKASLYASDFYNSDKAKEITKDDVKVMEKRVEKDLKKYGWREKLNYATNVRAIDEHPISSVLKGSGIALVATACAVSTAIDGQFGMSALITGVGLAAGMTRAATYYASAPRNDGEVRKVDEYTDLKHAQLALKQLKREFQKAEREEYRNEVSKLFAAGYGQPSGGLVQAAMLKGQNGR